MSKPESTVATCGFGKPGGGRCNRPVTHGIIDYYFTAAPGHRDARACSACAKRLSGFPNFMKVEPLAEAPQLQPGRPTLGPGRGRRAPVKGFRADPEDLARLEYLKGALGLPSWNAVIKEALRRTAKSVRRRGNG